jgi:hypothetical protein
MSGNDGEEVTPVPIPNTEVKLFSADGSWGFPPVRVGHCQADIFGGLAQLGEHLPYKQRVGGSIPSSSTIYSLLAGVAQLVEQLTCNQ